MDENFCDGRFAVIAQREPQAPAVLDQGRVFTFADIDARSELIGRWLSARGAGPEQVVAILAGRGADLPASALGVWKSGAAYLALDDETPRARLRAVLDAIRPAAILTQRQLRHRVPAGLAPVLCVDGGLAPEPPIRPGPRWPDQLAYVIYTSGSTGSPKRVGVSHRALLTIGDDWRRVYRLGDEVRSVLQAAGFGFDVATGDLVRGLLTGSCLICCPRETLLSPPGLYALMRRTGAAFADLTPSLLRPLTGYLRASGERLDFMRCLVAGGERWTRDDYLQTRAVTGPSVRIFNTYGLTEVAVDNTYCEVREAAPGQDVMPIGRGFAGSELRVLDPELRPVTEGELFIGGPQLARGYLGDPATTALRFIPAPEGPAGARLYRTGDLVRQLPDGNVVHLARRDSQVKIRGVRVDPLEVETILASHPAVQAAAVAVRERNGQPELAGYVVLAAGRPEVSVSALRRFAAARLPAAMVPAHVRVVPEIPVTQNGKADHARLATLAPEPAGPEPAGHLAAADSPGPPTAEATLLRIWSGVLGCDVTRTDQDFFELGGSSLGAAQVVTAVREQLGADLPPGLLYEHPTVAELAAMLPGAAPAQPVPTDPGRTQGPLSPGQQRLWVLHQLQDGLTAYNIPVVVRIGGPLDTDVLRRALGALLARHAALRTAFRRNGDGVPVQCVTGTGELTLTELAAGDDGTAQAQIEQLARRPFDLERPPLIRAALVRLPGGDSRLALVMHHLVADGQTVRIVLRELGELYSALAAGREPVLSQLPMSFLDYAAWQAGRLSQDDARAQLVSWRDRLAGVSTERLLPGAADPGRGPGQCRAELGPGLTGALRDLAREHRTTLFVTMIAAFAALLHRWSGRRDLVIGTPLSGRGTPGTEQLAGFFVDTVALRLRLPADAAFADLVRLARESVAHAARHQNVPFDAVQAGLGHSGGGPLFHTWFNFLGAPDEAPPMAGLSTEMLDAPVAGALFDVNVYVTELPGDLRIDLVYDTAHCDQPHMTALLGQYAALLRELAADPERPACSYSLVAGQARPAAPGPEPAAPELSAPELSLPELSLPELVAEQVKTRPDAIAIRTGDGEVSYRQLAEQAGQVAARLGGTHGRQLVAIYAPRGPALISALLGTLQAGASFCVLDPANPPGWLRRQLAAARPDILLHAPGAGPLPADLTGSVSAVAELGTVTGPRAVAGGPPTTLDGPGPGDGGYVVFTSGTTGEPQPIRGGQGPVVHFLRCYAARFGLGPDDRFTMLSGLGHDPLLRDIFAPLVTGAAVCVPPAALFRAPDELRAWLADEQVTVAHLTPAMIRLLASGRGARLPRLRLVMSGGDTLTAADIALVRDMAPDAVVVNAYGTTETPQVMSWEIIPPGQPAGPPGRRAGIGRAIDGVQVLVRAPGRGQTAVGEVGRIIVRTPYLTAGLGPEYDTGDLGRLRPDGTVELIGRADGQVKIDGFRADLDAVDSQLRRLPYVRDGLTAVRTGADGRNRLVSYVVPARGQDLLVERIRADLRTELPPYLLPAGLVQLSQLPLTPNGKHDRNALPPETAGRTPARAGGEPLGGPLEQSIAAIWRRALGGAEVGVETSFFDAGGSSMLMIWVQQQLQDELGLRVPVLDLFDYPTVRTLAAHLAGSGPHPPAGPGGREARTRHYPDSERRLTIRRELRLKDLS